MRGGAFLQLFFPKEIYKWPTGTQKDAQITNHQGTANQNTKSDVPHTYIITNITKKKKPQNVTSVGKNVKKGTLVNCFVGI